MSPENGWASTAHCILRTQDGGRTWIDVTPSIQKHTSHRLLPIWVNTETAFAIVNLSLHHSVLVRTTDAGHVWQTMGAFAKTGWMVARSRGAVGTEQIALESTNNGGRSWWPVFSDYQQTLGGGSKDVGRLTFVNAGQGWMTGSYPEAERVYLQWTQDGGQTWHPQTLPIPASFSHAQWQQIQMTTTPPQFFGLTHQSGIIPVTLGDQLWIYRTVDGGQHWTPTTPTDQPPQGTAASAIDFVTPQSGFVRTSNYTNHPPFGVQSRLWETINGGQTWQVVVNNLPPGNDTHLDFISQTIGWALTSQPQPRGSLWRLWRTRHGGHHWTLITASSPPPTPTKSSR
ncbi:MAG: hypothetical protein M1596_02470 [Firmicutes bacterium]|nr:hypothetical protein [Bacillota bacterium]